MHDGDVGEQPFQIGMDLVVDISSYKSVYLPIYLNSFVLHQETVAQLLKMHFKDKKTKSKRVFVLANC